ncbi:MAG: 50S ribosomal protein L29 [Acidobacteriota bacterium]|nr:50S ribosomal protein L29 [Acidobacteriota bacterium]
MKIDSIRDMENSAIESEIREQEKQLMEMRMGNAIGTVDNPVEIRYKRRDIARMKTVLRERQIQSGQSK